MSQPTNGDKSGNQSGGFGRPGSLGQGWAQDQNEQGGQGGQEQPSDSPYDAQSEAPGDPQQAEWGSGATQAVPSQQDGGSQNVGSPDGGSQQGGYSPRYEAQPSYSRPDEQEPTGFGQPGGYPAPSEQGNGSPQQEQQGGAQPAAQTYQAPAQQNDGFDQQGGYGQQAGQHSDYDQQGGSPGSPQGKNFGSQAQAQVGQVVGNAGDGVGALLSDFAFKKSLTEKLASLVFLITVVWAFLLFLANQVHNFGSQDFGGTSVRYMGTGSALLHLMADAVAFILTVVVARILLELAVNVAKIAGRAKQ